MATRPYLNVGAGDRYSLEWENIDLYGADHVRKHDIRQPLPYADATFVAVYGSLEHLTPTVRALSIRDLVPRLIGELKRRVLSPQATGEAHKWMYRLDEESGASRPRKPDSIYVEAAKAPSI